VEHAQNTKTVVPVSVMWIVVSGRRTSIPVVIVERAATQHTRIAREPHTTGRVAHYVPMMMLLLYHRFLNSGDPLRGTHMGGGHPLLSRVGIFQKRKEMGLYNEKWM